jgi:AraC-like DNA-binding protein
MEKFTLNKKYIPTSEIDLKWGFAVKDIGRNVIKKGAEYPSKGHPGAYMFSWESGRILDEFHFVLITDGLGVFESKTAGSTRINDGDGFLLFPGEWHRYKPIKEEGWTEKWIGFSGRIPELVINDIFFSKKDPVIRNCANVHVNNRFDILFQLIEKEPFGFQRLASGVCLQLLAELFQAKQNIKEADNQNTLFLKAKNLIHTEINGQINFYKMAEKFDMSYSKFRRDFKNHTGMAPLQYQLLLKIEKSKELLVKTDLKAKEIAFQMGFESDYYFSRIFKQKVGMTPVQFRLKRRAFKS